MLLGTHQHRTADHNLSALSFSKALQHCLGRRSSTIGICGDNFTHPRQVRFSSYNCGSSGFTEFHLARHADGAWFEATCFPRGQQGGFATT